MAEGTSTKSYDEMYKKAVFELLKKNWDYKNNRLNNSDIVDMETDRLRAEAALWAEAAEDNKKKSVNSGWFYSNVAPRVLKTIMDEFEVIQNMIDGMSGLSAEIQSVQHLAAYVDALHKTLTMVQQLEDINSKGMASEKQQ